MIKLALMSLLFLTSAYANSNLSRVEEVICGEFDSKELKEACLIVATSPQKTNLYITTMQDYTNANLQVRQGDFIDLSHNTPSVVRDLKVRVLAHKLTKNLPFHISEIYYLDYHAQAVSLSALSDVKTINCINDYFISDFMFGKIDFKAKLHFFQNNSYALKQTSLSYLLSQQEDLSDIWAKGSYSGGEFLNRYNYRPHVYKNHIKFGDVFSKEVFGTIDILIKKTDLKKKNFKAIVILSNMDDHFGDTVEVSCQSF